MAQVPKEYGEPMNKFTEGLEKIALELQFSDPQDGYALKNATTQITALVKKELVPKKKSEFERYGQGFNLCRAEILNRIEGKE